MADLWLSSVGVTPLDRDRERAFAEWCGRTPRLVSHPCCAVADLPTSGRSVVATRAIAEGDVVVEVKDDACLLAERSCIGEDLARACLTKDAQKHGGGSESGDGGGDGDPSSSSSSPDALLEVQALILALMAERLRGSESQWAGYVGFFPRELGGMPLFWSRRQRRRLAGTAAADKMRGRLQHPADAPTRVGELWRDVALPFILEGSPLLRRLLGLGEEEEEEEGGGEEEGAAAAAAPAPAKNKRRAAPAPPPAPPAPPSATTMAARVRAARRLYRWATAVVAAYSFVLGDDRYQALVPFWDALNHVSGRCNVRLAHDAGASPRGGGGGVLRMVATRAILPGEEVVNRYGPLSTSELLRGYGFVERGNPHAHAQVPAQFALRAAAAKAAVAAAAEAAAVAAAKGKGGSNGGKSGQGKRRPRPEDESEDDDDVPPPEAWAELGAEFALVDSDAEVDLDLEDEEEEEDEDEDGDEEDDGSCSDAGSGSEGDGAASEDEDQEEEAGVDAPLPPLGEAQRRAPCWPLVFCAARALRLLPRGGAFRVPGVAEAEDDEKGGGDAEAAVVTPATAEEQRGLLERLMRPAAQKQQKQKQQKQQKTKKRSGSKAGDDDDGDDGDEEEGDSEPRAERYAAARRAAAPRFPDALAAFVLMCLHGAQSLPPPAAAAPGKRGGGKKKKSSKRQEEEEEEEEEDDDDERRPAPPAGVAAIAEHLLELARGGAPSPLRTARALASLSGPTPRALRAACLATLAAMRRRYRGGGLERDRARAAPERLPGLAPRRAAALLARLEEQEALEAARAEVEAEEEGALMARACAAAWVALARRAGTAREAAAKAEAEAEAEEEGPALFRLYDRPGDKDDSGKDGDGGKQSAKKTKGGARFAFNFAV